MTAEFELEGICQLDSASPTLASKLDQTVQDIPQPPRDANPSY